MVPRRRGCCVRFLLLPALALLAAGCLESYEDLSTGPGPNDGRGNFTSPGSNASTNATTNGTTNSTGNATRACDDADCG